nr:MAG TPA: hypothetical protein [Caudoviricetes sp.]
MKKMKIKNVLNTGEVNKLKVLISQAAELEKGLEKFSMKNFPKIESIETDSESEIFKDLSFAEAKISEARLHISKAFALLMHDNVTAEIQAELQDEKTQETSK